MQVAIQGIKGSFHEEAARSLIGPDTEIVACETFQDVFKTVKNGLAERGVVAIENSLHGSINPVYRLLAREKLWVAGEVFLKIEQFLIGTPDGELTDVAEVLSQAPAIAQCEQWLDSHLPEAMRQETHDTAESVRYVVRENNRNFAAIASRRAAEIYEGKILAGPINDDPHNYTRFFLLSTKPVEDPAANRTSIILTTGHEPGALYAALSIFAEHNINLSKLDSHPIAGDKRHYAFYIDFDAPLSHPDATSAIKALEASGCTVNVLGSYPKSELPL